MRIERRNWVLAALLVLLVGARAALRSGGAGAEREVGPLFEALEPERVARVEIEDTDGRLALVRGASGWTLEERHGFPGHAQQIEGLIDRVRAVSTLDLLSEDSASHTEYGLGDDASRVRFLNESGTMLAGLVQGGTASDGRASYVRRVDGSEVYRASLLPRITSRPRQWVRGRVVELEPALVNAIRLSGTALEGSVELTRDEARIERWTDAAGETVGASDVRRLLDRLPALVVNEVVGRFDAARFGKPRLEVSLSTAGGGERTLRLGAEDEDGVLAAGSEEWMVRVAAPVADLVIESARALR